MTRLGQPSRRVARKPPTRGLQSICSFIRYRTIGLLKRASSVVGFCGNQSCLLKKPERIRIYNQDKLSAGKQLMDSCEQEVQMRPSRVRTHKRWSLAVVARVVLVIPTTAYPTTGYDVAGVVLVVPTTGYAADAVGGASDGAFAVCCTMPPRASFLSNFRASTKSFTLSLWPTKSILE